jgi:nitrate reductase gamma subunit
MQPSAFLHFSEHLLQEVAIGFMVVVYTIRLFWLFSWKGGKERQARTGRLDTSRLKGSLYSIANIAMPWAMESTRKKPLFYLTFALFHIGVTAAIGLSFVIPYAPGLLANPTVVLVIQILCFTACFIGVTRMIRRIANPYMRAISTPDDYFSLLLLTVWFPFAGLAAPNDISGGEGIMLIYFWMTAFFLMYVPFSKIGHYLYYPFARYWLGKTMGHRGVFPLQRAPKPDTAPDFKALKLKLSEIKEG